MKGNTLMQSHTNKGWRAARLVILPVLLVALSLLSPPCAAVKETFVLGKNIYDPTFSAPKGDATSTFSYPSGRTVYFSRTQTLAPANVAINWNSNHGSASSNSGVFCVVSDQGTANPITAESGFISAGSYGGVDIFKTNITGLYFSLKLRSISSYTLSVNPTSFTVQNGVMHNIINITDPDGCHTNTVPSPTPDQYLVQGGLSFYMEITFYTDQTYTPGSSTITLLKNGNYHLRFWNENPGPDIVGYYDNINIDISSVTVAEPTCSTQPVASGSSVSGTTVNLGSYSPNDIINGAASIPFAINLAGCKGLHNINVTLTTTTLANDPTILGNILTSNNAAGVGVEIRGAANNYSAEMVMVPNEATSVYNDQRDTSSDDNIYGTNENGTVQSQTLNFLATLKRDNNQQIKSGNFKANGIFTFDYP